MPNYGMGHFTVRSATTTGDTVGGASRSERVRLERGVRPPNVLRPLAARLPPRILLLLASAFMLRGERTDHDWLGVTGIIYMSRVLIISLTTLAVALCGCAATTTSQITPSPQKPVCVSDTRAMVLWVTHWRSDQKDVLAREAAAADGLAQFFRNSGCFKSALLERMPQNSSEAVQASIAEAMTRYDRVIVLTLREFGPTVKIGASPALIEGGTEVVLEVSEYLQFKTAPRTFTVQWRNGGPGVIKGVATLTQDMQAALATGLQPSAR